MIGQHWELPSSAAISADFSRDLRRPDNWLITDVYRIYHRVDEPARRVGITVVYVDSRIDQPILIGGRVDYASEAAVVEVEVPDRWILKRLWFQVCRETKALDGTPYRVRLDEAPPWGCPVEGTVFAVPLVSIQSKDDVQREICNRLMQLQSSHFAPLLAQAERLGERT